MRYLCTTATQRLVHCCTQSRSICFGRYSFKPHTDLCFAVYCLLLLLQWLFGGYRELAFQQSSTRDQIELLELQLQLEAKLGASYTFVDRSLADTIFQLICLAGEHSNSSASSSSAVAVGNAAALSSEALRLAKRFKVTAVCVTVLMVTTGACYCS
jgi:hypothetical protein